MIGVRFLTRSAVLVALVLGSSSPASGQDAANRIPPDQVRALIESYKQSDRGPFASIRWFCTDGTTVGARERCAQPGGIQHAQHRDDALALARRNHVYVAQILAGTDFETFLDRASGFSRLKQYQLGNFLFDADGGWVLRRAQFYRGAFQIEDEEDWGRRFLPWLLTRDSLVATQFFVLREAVRTIPHGQASDLVQRIRAESKEVSDAYGPFMDVRVKIHGQPDRTDIERVRRFEAAHRARLNPELQRTIASLVAAMEEYYAYDGIAELRRHLARLPSASDLVPLLRSFVNSAADATPERRVATLTELMLLTRELAIEETRGARRLVLMDLSIEMERYLQQQAASWRTETLADGLRKAAALVESLAGTGLIELDEWDVLSTRLNAGSVGAVLASDGTRRIPTIRASNLRPAVDNIRRSVDWAVGMVVATFEAEIAKYVAFEPLAAGFVDDRVRSSPLLALGELSGTLSAVLAERTGRVNDISLVASGRGVRGLNSGIARGNLVVVTGDPESVEFESDKIYALSRAPADLKPVAGIMTVTEGSTVSHVQLLARNLGIPNAAITPEALRELAVVGEVQVFFAVSPRGGVRLKPAADMDAAERALVEERVRAVDRIQVSTARMDLRAAELQMLTTLRVGDSGRVCGPKAANLGQLSSLFPDQVAPGFIIPFGVFRDHMDQPMPQQATSYWGFLTRTFKAASDMRAAGREEREVDDYVLAKLAELRTAIEAMPLKPDFVSKMQAAFNEAFRAPLGQVPVFIRSDTNMEDLKDFTGAGLNLTVPNVYTQADILQAVRRVWASPYRERGYRWRQKYLLNPEDVYPSLLVLKSVNVDKSGVMITTGIESGNPDDVTVAFNHGVGGAVDGQAAESYLLEADGDDVLLSPAREPTYNELPPRGGTRQRHTGFSRLLLTPANREDLRSLSVEIKSLLPNQPGIDSRGPFDVELGFLNGKIWLFQVRPFVENRMAGAMTYLMEMDASLEDAMLDLNQTME